MTLRQYQMHKKARDFAIKHRMGLVRMSSGQYCLMDGDHCMDQTNGTSAENAIAMMKRALRGGFDKEAA